MVNFSSLEPQLFNAGGFSPFPHDLAKIPTNIYSKYSPAVSGTGKDGKYLYLLVVDNDNQLHLHRTPNLKQWEELPLKEGGGSGRPINNIVAKPALTVSGNRLTLAFARHDFGEYAIHVISSTDYDRYYPRQVGEKTSNGYWFMWSFVGYGGKPDLSIAENDNNLYILWGGPGGGAPMGMLLPSDWNGSAPIFADFVKTNGISNASPSVDSPPSLILMSKSTYFAHRTDESRIMIQTLVKSGGSPMNPQNTSPKLRSNDVAFLTETCIDGPGLGVLDDKQGPWLIVCWFGTDTNRSLNVRRLSIDKREDPLSYSGFL
jgi:hypothetical protein